MPGTFWLTQDMPFWWGKVTLASELKEDISSVSVSISAINVLIFLFMQLGPTELN